MEILRIIFSIFSQFYIIFQSLSRLFLSIPYNFIDKSQLFPYPDFAVYRIYWPIFQYIYPSSVDPFFHGSSEESFLLSGIIGNFCNFQGSGQDLSAGVFRSLGSLFSAS